VEVVASLSQGRTAAAQCGLFTHKSVPVIFETPCNMHQNTSTQLSKRSLNHTHNSNTSGLLDIETFSGSVTGV